ncbi:MAG: AbrB/MazE/SpoVT family DNA-binding domain-containing protein [Clostridia bacterium]|nr:AbrB/MazE/SpoVT family DNA-binding domain-containing protein [Clostridia bacterium]
MSKMLKILGKEGRITIPFEIRLNMRIAYNDILSFEQMDSDTIIIKREKLCTNCCDGKGSVGETTLLDVINSLNITEQREVLKYLAKKLT